MNKKNEQEIPLSKMKMMLLFSVAVVFVVLGLILIIFEPESINHSNRHAWVMNPIIRFFAGLIFLICFGIAAITILFRLFNKKPGLIIDEKGVFDNSSVLALGFIPWKDIRGFEMVTVNNNRFILILLQDPTEYLSRTTHWLKLKGLKMNLRYYNTPICLSAHSLQINVNELYKLLRDKMEHFTYESQHS